MKLSFSAEDEQFREEIATWLQQNLTGEFEKLRFRGGPGDEHIYGMVGSEGQDTVNNTLHVVIPQGMSPIW